MMDARNNSPWESLAHSTRKRLVWWFWLLTWLLLLGGLWNFTFYHWVVVLTACHSVVFLWLFNFRLDPFPVQVRLAYFVWVCAGTYVPGLIILIYITTVGLAANLFLNYCPLARLMVLMPWNRSEPLSKKLIKQVFLTPPTPGKFIIPHGE